MHATAGRRSQRARVLLFASAVLFGLTALLVRIATRAPGMTGERASLVRFAVGLTAVSALLVARPGTFAVRSPGLLAARAGFGGASALLYFKALAVLPAGEATLLNNTFPAWAVLLSYVALRERPPVRLLLALATAAAGAFLVIGGGDVHVHLGAGEAYALGSGVCGGVAVTAIRALRQAHSAATVFLSFCLGGLAASSAGAFGDWHYDRGTWLAAAAVGATAFAAQMAMTEAYGAISVAEAAVWQQLTPMASFGWALLLGERITVATGAGLALGALGLAGASIFAESPAQQPPGAPRPVD